MPVLIATSPWCSKTLVQILTMSRRSSENDGYLLSLFYLHHWWCSEIDSHSPCTSRQFCWQNSCPVWSGSRWELACDLLDWWERNQNIVIGPFPPLPPLLRKNKQQHKLIPLVGLSWHEQSTYNWQRIVQIQCTWTVIVALHSICRVRF